MSAAAQTPDTICGTPDWSSLPADQQQLLQQLEEHTRQFIAQQTPSSVVNQNESFCPVYTIPVVVHLVNNYYSDAHVCTQIDILNKAFLGMNREILNPASPYRPLPDFVPRIGRFRIAFRLAHIDPNGLPTTGITRVSSSAHSFNVFTTPLSPYTDFNEDMKRTAHGGADAWDPSHYLNIWVVNYNPVFLFGIVAGRSTFPSSAGAWYDGVVVNTPHFNHVTASIRGRTLIHEVGHWMNLRHPWSVEVPGHSTCKDDHVSDTPLSIKEEWNPVPRPYITACTDSSGEMLENYMSYYREAYQVMFTQGQKQRAYAVFAPGGPRASIVAPSALNPPIAVTFSTSPTPACMGQPVTLTASLEQNAPGTPCALFPSVEYQLYATTGGNRVAVGAATTNPVWTITPIQSTTFEVEARALIPPAPGYPAPVCSYLGRYTGPFVTATAQPGGPYYMYSNFPVRLNGRGQPAGGTGVWSVAGGQFPAQCGGTTLAFVDAVNGVLPSGIAPGTYALTYTYTTANNCDTDADTTRLIVSGPAITVLPGGPYVFYNTGGQTLNGGGQPGGGTGQWSVLTTNGLFPRLAAAGGGSVPFVNATTGELPAGIQGGVYTVRYTYTLPGCQTSSATTTLTILERECALEQTPPTIVWKPGPRADSLVLNGQGTTVMLPSGIYHVRCRVTLTRGHFVTKPGTRFLFEAGTSLTIGAEASLTAPDTYFTAACDQMWSGLVVGPTSAGLYIGNPAADLRSRLPDVAPYGGGPLYGGISHAVNGVTWRDPNTAPLRLVGTRLFNNLTGVRTDPYGPARKPDVHPNAAIVNSVFDSKTNAFKLDTTNTLYADWLPLAHLDLGGWYYGTSADAVVMPFYGNSLADACLGIANPKSIDPFSLLVGEGNLFARNRLMSLGVPTLTNSIEVGVPNKVPNLFRLPLAVAGWRPSVRLDSLLRAQYPWLDPVLRTSTAAPAWGVWVGWHGSGPPQNRRAVRVVNAQFSLDGGGQPLGNHSFPRTGVEVEKAGLRYQLVGNSFANLYTGVRLGLAASGEDCEVTDNTFTDCGTGIAVRNAYTTAGLPPLVFWPQCNTFVRGPQVSGDNAGILVERSAVAGATAVVMDDYADFSAGRGHLKPMRNHFMGRATSGGRFTYLLDQTRQSIIYMGYQASRTGVGAFNTVPDIRANSSPSFDVRPLQIRGRSVEYDPIRHACRLDSYNNGFQRPSRPVDGAKSDAEDSARGVEQNRPNPVVGETTIAYAVRGATRAELLVRDVVGGAVVRRVTLDPAATSAVLSVAGLPTGIYSYSVVADEVVLGTRKLVVAQ